MAKDLNSNLMTKAEILRAPSIAVETPRSDGVIQWIRDLFRMTSATIFDVQGTFDEENETERVEQADKLLAFYSGNADEVESYLRAALSRTFTAQDIAEFQYLYIPVTRRIIEKMCKVYSVEVDRYLSTETLTDTYNEILDASDIKQKQIEWHRMAKLFDTVLVQPVVREIDGVKVLQFDVWTPNKVVVIEKKTNFLEPDAVIYAIQRRDEYGDPVLQYVYWSENSHYLLDETGKKIVDEENKEGVNPYGELPFVVLRMRSTDNFWGEGQTVLVNAEEKIDVLLVQLMDLLIMQTHGQPVLTNAEIVGSVQTGPKHPLVLRSADPAQPAGFEFASTNAKIQDITQAIDWIIERVATMYGLSKTSLMEQSQSASGYAKLLDSWDMLEIRNDDISILTDFERRLFKKVRKILEVEGLATIPESETLGIEFEEYQYPLDPKVELEVKKLKMELGLWSPVYELMAGGMTDEEARSEVQKVMAMNKEVLNGLERRDQPRNSEDRSVGDSGDGREMV